MSILCLNAGSSTIKAALFDDGAEREMATLTLPWAGDAESVRDTLLKGCQELDMKAPGEIGTIRAVGHRVVHSGGHWRDPVRIDEHVRSAMARCQEFAPLHNPSALQTIAAAQHLFHDLPHVAAFDTTFFADLPARSVIYPLPYEWREAWGIRRFGFHGLSHEYATGRAAELLKRDVVGLRVVVLHLGNGCSASAVRDGKPVATSMGFTAVEGLMMGTRCGSVDPGILMYMLRRQGFDVETLDRVLNFESGLLGVSGVSSDIREVQEAADEGNGRAWLALDIYAERARAMVAALAVSMGGLDALVFTAGVGENAPAMRASICDGLECLGLRLDVERNEAAHADQDVAAGDSKGRILVIRAREALMIARATKRVAEAELATA